MIHVPDKLNPSDWSFIKTLSDRCTKAGGKVFLVGGTVRSALMGEQVSDCDIEIFGLRPEDIESILSRLGNFHRVGKSFGIYKIADHNIDIGLPRIESKKGEGHRGFDVEIKPDLPLDKAAMRRDFTLNALYYDVSGDKILDPLGGLNDLERKILRHCSAQFSEDPLRVLRAMQFAARLPATVAPETVLLCSQLSPEGLSAERFYGEWEKLILSGIQPSKGLEFLVKCDWIQYFPSLQMMIDCPQDPKWHPEGDVWTHILHCMNAYARNRTGIHNEDLIVGLAVLCHDMGKPLTTVIDAEKIYSHGHEHKGLKPAKDFMKQLKVPQKIVDDVLPLIECHMRPSMLFENKSSVNAIRRLARDCGRLDLLMRVYQADSAGRPPFPDNSASGIEWILSESERVQAGNSGPDPLIRGNDLLSRGWPSGPAMGRLLKQAYEAQLDGAFTTKEGADAWLDQKLNQSGNQSDDRTS